MDGLDLFWLMLAKHRVYKRCPAARSVTCYVEELCEDPNTGGISGRKDETFKLKLKPILLGHSVPQRGLYYLSVSTTFFVPCYER